MFKIKRKPDLVIGINYLSRWYIIPRNHYFNIYLHEFNSSDEDKALHDHPWHSVSFLLKGNLLEYNLKGKRSIPKFIPIIRSAKFTHRLELIKGPAVTLFITGPNIRKWGFHCKNGWVYWKDFLTKDSTGNQRGCD